MKKAMLLIILLLSAQLQASPKTTVLDDWQRIASNTVIEGATISIAEWDNAEIYIACIQATSTTHTGTVFNVQISPSESGDETWFTHGSWTAFQSQTVGSLTLVSSATITTVAGSSTLIVNTGSLPWPWGKFDDDGVRTIFLLGSPTVANSELCTLVSHSAGAATSVTILDGLMNTPGMSSTLWDTVETLVYSLPEHTNRVRVIHDNSYDSDGATIYTYTCIFGYTNR